MNTPFPLRTFPLRDIPYAGSICLIGEPFSGLWNIKGVGILKVEVYQRVQKSVI